MTGSADLRRPIDLVIASAGTGKTYRLVNEVNEAIEAGAETGSIMATTFTNKAAAELLERARSKLLEEGKPGQAAGLLAARVGTVNSTFGRIVSEFALHAGRSPVADVISEERQERMFAIAAEDAIDRRLEAIAPIAQRLDVENWEASVRRLADLARQNDIDAASLAQQADRSWQGLREIFPQAAEQSRTELDARLREALAEARVNLEQVSDTTKKTAAVRQFIRRAGAIMESGGELPWSDWVRLSKLAPGVASRELVQPVMDLAALHATHPGLHADLEAYIRGVYATAAEALERYADYKASNGLVDFIDQEHEALRLLDNPEVAGHLGETVCRVFVDEFQDTSPIQLALFLKVSQIADRSFWVGDPKQAIYGFRGTDPELIDKAAREVVPRSGGKRDTLSTSYRSRPGLVEFTNLLFTPAFEALGFEPQSVRIEHCNRSDAEQQAPPIEVWGLAGRNIGLAFDALAGHIRTVLDCPEEHPVYDKAVDALRPIRGSDIALLCRQNTRCAEIAAALAKVGVRVSLAREGLLETPEATLATAALRYLVDPGDSLAIAEIAHLCDDAPGQPAWFERSLSDAGIRSLAEELPVLVALDRARADLAELTPREALETAMTASGVLDRIHVWGSALDRTGNLDALRGIATEYEDESLILRRAATAAGLVTWIANSESSAPKLPPSTDPSAVQVLSYHRAKGLEWPMVIMLELQSAREPSAFEFTVEADDRFDIWAPLKGRWVRFWPWPYGRQKKGVYIDASVLDCEEHRRATHRELAESARLLYVGMTRARDYLVLAPQGTAGTGLKLQWIDRLVDREANPIIDFSRLVSGGEPAAAGSVLAVAGTDVPVQYRELTATETPPPAEGRQAVHRMSGTLRQGESSPYRIVPSATPASEGITTTLLTRAELGSRIPISGNPDMALLGEAVHAFIAGDSPHRDTGVRRERAAQTLARWGVSGLLPEGLVQMSDRLYRHLESEFPGMAVRSEVPVFANRDGQRLNGRIDLLLTGEARAIVIDHKSYPGAFDTWEKKALEYAPQLALYASVIGDALDCTEVQTWVHLPVVGQLIQVRTES